MSRLCADLGGMVNNPQLSDVQLQVDNGNVYFAHSFMLYTRCPLLAHMVNTPLSLARIRTGLLGSQALLV